ncbi:hypothetical protein [Jiangella muralis]|uniref:hypothetical protein n=1 Tax=Jiangella muralis TaxID=702383 RepID=UPI00069DE74E|nr:hypothetical protein [Jiangella muralis]
MTRDLRELHRKAALLPREPADPRLAFWCRSGLSSGLAAGVWGFGPADVLATGESHSPARR